MKLTRLVLQFIAALLVVACLIIALRQLIASNRYSTSLLRSAVSSESLRAAMITVETEKNAVILAALAADKAEHDLRKERATRRKMAVASQERLWGALWFGMVVSIFSGALVVCMGIAGAIVKVFWIHGDVVAGAFVRKALPEEYKLQTALVKERVAQLKAMGMDMRALPEVIETQAIERPAFFRAPDVREALESGLMSTGPDFFLGTNSQTGEHETENLIDAASSIKVGGKQRKGKSNTLKNIAAQSLLKGWLNIWIDLHNPNKKSFVVNMGSLAKLPQVKIYSDRESAVEALCFIDSLIDRRLHGHDDSQTPVLIVVDEILNLVNMLKKQKIDASEVFKRVVTEGGKNLIFMVAAAHTWTGNEVGSTGFRDGFDMLFAHKMAPLQAGTFGIKNKAAKDACDLLGVGQTIFMDCAGEIRPVSVPFWTDAAIEYVKKNVAPKAWDIDVTSTDVKTYRDNVTPLFKKSTDVPTYRQSW